VKDILNKAEAAELLDCEESTAEQQARAGLLPAVKIGRSWLYPSAALIEHINTLARANVQHPVLPRTAKLPTQTNAQWLKSRADASIAVPVFAKRSSRGTARPVLPSL
jgi:excisionase family DNA binding protein